MKQNQKHNLKSLAPNGFTIIELLVVIAVMGLMATLLVINFNATRSRRNLTIAGNELITNIKKVQSYALSARDVAPNVPAKYYVMRFFTNTPGQYQILAIDNEYNSPPELIETVTLPQDVVYEQAYGNLQQPISEDTSANITNPGCLQILFGLPFGRIYMAGSAKEVSACSDDIVQTVQDPAAMANMANSKAIISLRSTKITTGTRGAPVYISKNAEINGLSGTIVSVEAQ